MLLSFKFLIACTVGVELLISEENLLFISIGVVFASLFLGVLSGEVLTICLGLRMKSIRLQLYHCISRYICILGTLTFVFWERCSLFETIDQVLA